MVKTSNYQVKSSSGELLDVQLYEAEEPRGLVHILHGMEEHKERYEEFALFLVRSGFSVLTHDHLGHGKSISPAHPIGDMIGFDYVLRDIDLVRRSATAEEGSAEGKSAEEGHAGKSAERGSARLASCPYICFGHSMGSFLARIYASKYKVDLLIACGTGQNSGIMAALLKFVVFFQKPGVPLYHIQKMVTGPMGKAFDTPADWLSYNKENQERYLSDPLCGRPFTKAGYRTLADIVRHLNRTGVFRDCTADHILLISGEDDPVGNFGKGVRAAEARYRRFGKDVRAILYPNMTHEILNETDKHSVYSDVLDFLTASLE